MPRPRPKTRTSLAFESAAREKKEDGPVEAVGDGDSDADTDADEDASTRSGGEGDDASLSAEELRFGPGGGDDDDDDVTPRDATELRKAMRVREYPVVESSALEVFKSLRTHEDEGAGGSSERGEDDDGNGGGGGPRASLGSATRTLFRRQFRGKTRRGADDGDGVGDGTTSTDELEEDGFYVEAKARESSLLTDGTQNSAPVPSSATTHCVDSSSVHCAVGGGDSACGERSRAVVANRARNNVLESDGSKSSECNGGGQKCTPPKGNCAGLGGRRGFADLCIYPSRLVFTCHPEFLREERLYRELQTAYGKYASLVQCEKTVLLEERLRALVKRGQALARRAGRFSEEKCDPDEPRVEGPTPVQIISDVADALRSLVESMGEIKALEDSLWDKWRSLVRAREEQGFTCTQGVDLYHEDVPRRDIGNSDVGEVELSSITSPLKRLLPQLQRHIREATQSESDLDSEELESMMSAVQQLGGLSRRTVLTGDLKREEPERTLLRNEQRRRTRIENERYFLEVLVNGKVVERTPSNRLAWPGFTIDFEKIFRCKTLHRSPSVCVQVYKERFGGILRGYPLCSIFVRVPSSETSGPSISWYQFGSSTLCASDCALSFGGHILVATQWKRNIDCDSDDFRAVESCGEEMSLQPLITPSDKSKLTRTQYGGPVKNEEMMESHLQQPAYGSLNGPSGHFMFSERRGFQDHLLKEPMRHSLIKTREIDEMLVPSPIPLNEKSIYQDKSYHHIIRQSAAGESKQAVADGTSDLSQAPQILRRAKERILVTRPVHVTEIVRDVSYLRAASQGPDFQSLFGLLFPERKRSLYPRAPKQQPGKVNTGDYKLIVLVSGARNIPQRRTGGRSFHRMENMHRRGSTLRSLDIENGLDADDMRAEDSCANVTVKIMFQGKSYWTSAVSSPNPTWKHTVSFPLMDCTGPILPHTLMHLQDRIEITMFDTCDIDIGSEGGFYDDESTTTNENRYLGQITVPFSSIYLRGSIQGSFRLDCPDVIVGYSGHQFESTSEGDGFAGDEGDSNSSVASSFDSHEVKLRGATSNMALIQKNESRPCVDLLITTDPVQHPPESIPCESMSEEDDTLLRYIYGWKGKYLQRCPKRASFSVITPGPDGLGFCVNRFFKSQQPPKEMDSVHKCSHFVGLVPTNEQKPVTVWRTSQDFLTGDGGSRAEHAILLANYFSYLSDKYPDECGADVRMVIGLGFPEGQTAYVMRKESSGDVQFWDASTSHAYALEDQGCPLHDIWCLVDKHNIYANIQKSGVPCEMRFDLHDKRCWMPLFSQQSPITLPLQSIQEDLLSYEEPDHQAAMTIQDELAHDLKISVRSWRRGLTKFRSELSEQLRHALELLETAMLEGKRAKQSVLDELYESVGEKSLSGVPLHFSLPHKQDITSQVKATGIHLTKRPDVEFAVAVRVYAYPSNVLSVWVFVVAVSPAFPYS